MTSCRRARRRGYGDGLVLPFRRATAERAFVVTRAVASATARAKPSSSDAASLSRWPRECSRMVARPGVSLPECGELVLSQSDGTDASPRCSKLEPLRPHVTQSRGGLAVRAS